MATDASGSEVRVFISSTFSDMQSERDHLVTVVFPELRERLERLGLEFFDVDLRWGVPTEVDGEKTNSWEYCRKWIDRVEPFFVCILGERYGWIPGPEELPEEDRRYAGRSITDMEVHHGVLTDPHLKRSFFYLRNEDEPATVPQDIPPAVRKRFVDMVEVEEGQEPTEVDNHKKDRLRELKRKIRVESGRPVRDYPCRWNGGGFNDLDEFGTKVLEDLWSGVLRDERYVPRSAWREVLGHDPTEDPIYTDDDRPVPEEVWSRLVEAARPAPQDQFEAEAEEMARFARSRLRWFHGREDELRGLRSFVEDPGPETGSRLCVVRAVPGQGKSALLAKLETELASSPHLVITHYVGASERSADVRWILERLSEELGRNGVPATAAEDEPGRIDVETLRRRLSSQLEEYAGDRRIVIVIDALNQLGGGHTLTWLPGRLGAGVRLIVSCITKDDLDHRSPEGQVLTALESRGPDRWVDVAPLDPDRDVREIVEEYLEEYSKELDASQIQEICGMEQARNPLYLLVMLHELRTLGGFDIYKEVPTIIRDMPAKRPHTVAMFAWILERLEASHGPEPVRRWWSYLALGRVGMASGELSELLAGNLGEEHGATALRIERGIRRYLQPRGAQLDFFHGQLRDAVERQYLGRREPEGDEGSEPPAVDGDPFRVEAHREIARYFRRKADPSGEGKWDRYERGLSELPFHLIEGADGDDALWEEVTDVLTDFTFLERKASDVGVERRVDAEGKVVEETYTGVYQIKDDLDLALARMPGGDPEAGGDRRRTLIVTAVDFGKGGSYVIRCPHCNTMHRLDRFDDDPLGEEINCPNEECKGPLKVNDFVVPPRG